MKKDSTAAVDPSGLIVEKQAKIATDQIIAKCKNQTGQDLSMASFLVSYYSGDKLVGTQTASIGDICDGQEFPIPSSRSQQTRWHRDKEQPII